ncbi:MAG TPA: muconolactone Delta-isomerase family protein [Solirubrobacterales bacterium]|jgi:muconolactone D-isomerase|nr:muconolactone Delta-isomerase family protein [Solirubrobacterales bacterium]
MEFLVTIELERFELAATEESDLRERERATGERYMRDGALLRMWRLPGRRASVSLWKVDDADRLHELLSGFPFFPWMDITVVPLARHYLEEGREAAGGGAS